MKLILSISSLLAFLCFGNTLGNIIPSQKGENNIPPSKSQYPKYENLNLDTSFTLNAFLNVNSIGNTGNFIFFGLNDSIFDSSSVIRSAVGVLKNGYSVHIKSCHWEENYWLEASFFTTSLKFDFWQENVIQSDYENNLNREILSLAPIVFKDIELIELIMNKIKSGKYELDKNIGNYSIETSNSRYDEVTISIQHIDFYSIAIKFFAKGSQWN